MRMARSRPRRSGMTLVELLAVIAIVVTIIGLGMGAYFRVRASQEIGATRTTVQKLQTQFDGQWRAVLDNAKDDARNSRIPKEINDLAGNDSRRALVIWTKIKLKLEFPQNFFEAVIWPGQNVNKLTSIGFEAKPSYAKALKNFAVRDPSTMSVDEQLLESAALLYMALSQSRRGQEAFDPAAHIGPHALGKVTLVDANNVTHEFDCFKDSWGKPICFIRWPFSGRATELNESPYWSLNNSGQPIDPQDPENTLQAAAWYTGQANLRTFFVMQMPHPIDAPPLRPLNLSPIIFSLGPDMMHGLADAYFGRAGSEEDDNIYGYRLRTVEGK